MAQTNNLTTGQRVGAQTVDNFQVQTMNTQGLDAKGYSAEFYAGNSTGFNASIAFNTAGNTLASPTALLANNTVGNLDVWGYQGSAYNYSGGIDIQTSGAWSSTSAPIYIATNLTPTGGTAPAYYNIWDATGNYNNQPTPTALTATATLTIAQIQTNIIEVTSAAAVTLTLPAGAAIDAGIISGNVPVGFGYDWHIINLGSSSGAITMAAGVTGSSYVGNATVAIGTGAWFRTVKTAANTFVTYRLI